MRKVRLYGWLAREFGREFELEVRTPAEAVRALCVVAPGFKDAIRRDTRHLYRVLVGAEILDPEKQLHDPAGDVIRLVPVVAGAKDGFTRVLVGAALIGLALWNPMGWAAIGAKGAWGLQAVLGIGISTGLGGVSQLLAKQPGFDPSLSSGPKDDPTFTFAGPVNTQAQGYPVPVAYGRIRVGSAIVSGGIDSQAFRRDHGAPDEAGTRGGNGDTTPWVWAIAPK